MLTIDRWRKWHPSDEKPFELPTNEPPKPSKSTFEGFDGSSSGQTQNLSRVGLYHDPRAWAEDFQRWALARCVYRDRCFGGIGALHTDFCEWAIVSESVPCQRRTFEVLLTESGFLLAEGLVSGLFLTADLWALEPPRGPRIAPSTKKGGTQMNQSLLQADLTPPPIPRRLAGLSGQSRGSSDAVS